MARHLLRAGAGLLAGGFSLAATRQLAFAQSHAGHGAESAKKGLWDDAPSADPATRTPSALRSGHTPVVTLNGSSLPFTMNRGVKEFRLTAEPVRREFAPGMMVSCWGYNGASPGPTIEAVEGDRVRILVTNKLPEHTTIHWHGQRLPAGMDGVGGLSQPHIPVGETWAYEFTLRRAGTYMYHPHSDEMVQMAMGMMGMFIVHPRDPATRRVDRDFCFLLQSWKISPGTYTPDTSEMLNFNLWSFNSRVFPGIDPLVVRKGDRVRIRIGNLTMTNHPIHLHGHEFVISGTDGGVVRESARWPEVTTDIPVGAMRDLEFIADEPGDWAFHCHKSHHTMGPMGHEIPNMIGVDQKLPSKAISGLFPGYMYMPMGSDGMAEMQDMVDMGMALPENTLPMMTGEGPFGPIEMGSMFTTLKVRADQKPGDYTDPGWYEHPPGTVAYKVG